jgi:hypothetical protein
VIAAQLRDVAEDQGVPFEEIAVRFGGVVAVLEALPA